jgi:hypothetical protein
MRAIDRKDLKLLTIHISNPARNIRGVAIPRIDDGISINREAGLACGKLFQFAE